MKTITGMLLLATLIFAGHYTVPQTPELIAAAPLTEASITKEVKFEQKEKEYKRATATARMVYRRNGCRAGLEDITGRVAVDSGISPRILAALVFVESSCNPNAGSSAFCVGLTQINPAVWRHSQAELKDPVRNLEIGAAILAGYIRQYGLKEGLHRYNGLGDESDTYSNKVLTSAGILI